MEIKGLHVAIVHRLCPWWSGGGVASDCLPFLRPGYSRASLPETHIETEWALPDDPLIDLSLLPPRDASLDKESAFYLVRALRREVKVLIILSLCAMITLIRAAGIKIVIVP